MTHFNMSSHFAATFNREEISNLWHVPIN